MMKRGDEIALAKFSWTTGSMFAQ